MRIKFIQPDQIAGAVLALLILGVGVFAAFTVFANIPATVPAGSANRAGNGTLYDATSFLSNTTDPVLRWFPTPNFINNTAVVVVRAEGHSNSGGFDQWYVLQAAGAANGTFCSNGTYRTGHDWGPHNATVSILYSTTTARTTTLSNSTYTAVMNVSATSTQVFNIIGIVLVLASIMAIVGLVYSYIRPRM